MRVLNKRTFQQGFIFGILLSWAFTCFAASPQNKDMQKAKPSPAELLSIGVENSGHNGIRVVINFLRGNSLLGYPFKPIGGLDKPEVVPFLIDVIENGPNKPGEKILSIPSYLECCYAALCLGYIKDARAFEPLSKIVQRKDYLGDNNKNLSSYKDGYPIWAYAALALGNLGDKRAYEPILKLMQETSYPVDKSKNYSLYNKNHLISSYAALALGYLGDVRAIEPLLVQMKKHEELDESIFTIQAIAMFRDISTIKPIITYLSGKKSSPGSTIHECLEYITGVHFGFGSSSGLKSQIKDIPELQNLKLPEIPKVVWKYWWEHREEYAKNRFDRNYPTWKKLMDNAKDDEARKKIGTGNMLTGGIAVLPYLIDSIEKGDKYLIPIAAGMTKQYKPNNYRQSVTLLGTETGTSLSEKATIAETMEWWQKNKDNWTLKDSD